MNFICYSPIEVEGFKMKLLVFVGLLMMASCASSPRQKDTSVLPEVKYQAKSDYFASKADFAIGRETLELDLSVNVGSDQLALIIKQCHSGDFAKAYDLSGELYPQYKNHPGYWNAVGVCFWQKGEVFRAKQFFSIALEKQHRYFPALNNLAIISVNDKDWDQARALLEEAHKIEQRSQVVNYNLGRLYLAFGHYSNALTHLNLLRDSDFKKSKANLYMGIAQMGVKRYQQALELIKPFYLSDKKKDYLKVYYALTLLETDQKSEARKVISDLQIDRRNSLFSYYQRLKRGLDE